MEYFENQSQSKIFSIAPMMGYTDRHFRYFFRLVSRKAILYTEMIPEKTIIYNLNNQQKLDQYLKFHPDENPLILQIGGSDPDLISSSIPIIEFYGYQGINLNCGCPSEKVQKGKFGAVLMNEPELVGKIINNLKKKTNLPVSIKLRLGIKFKNPDYTDYNYLKKFINITYNMGCKHYIVHARHAILDKISPRDNRKIPPLLYEWVYNLKKDFPYLKIEINGGIQNFPEALRQLEFVDGVMIGRAAYQNPYEFLKIDGFYNSGLKSEFISRKEIFKKMYKYIYKELQQNVHPQHILKHYFNLFYKTYGAKKFKNFLIHNIFQKKLSDLQKLKEDSFYEILDSSLSYLEEFETLSTK